MTKKIYVITWGSYHDIEIVGVTLGKKAAKKLVRRLNERDDDEYDFRKADYLSPADIYEREVHTVSVELTENGSIVEPPEHTVRIEVLHPAVPPRHEGTKVYTSQDGAGVMRSVRAVGDDEADVRAKLEVALLKAQKHNVERVAAWDQLQVDADRIYEHMVKRGDGS